MSGAPRERCPLAPRTRPTGRQGRSAAQVASRPACSQPGRPRLHPSPGSPGLADGQGSWRGPDPARNEGKPNMTSRPTGSQARPWRRARLPLMPIPGSRTASWPGGHRRSSVRVRVANLNLKQETTMTDDRMALIELIEKRADTDLVREMLAFAAERLMDLEVETLTGRASGRAQPRAAQSPQRLSRARLGHARGPDRPRHPQAAQGLLLSVLPGAAAHGREGAHGGDPGGLRPRDLDPGGGRPRQGHGRVRHLQEPSLAAVRGDRRAGERLPQPAPSRALGPICGSTRLT